MDREQMDRLIEARLAAEAAADPAGAVAVYTEDVEHDLVGAVRGSRYGRAQAQAFYAQRVRDMRTQEMIPVRASYGEDPCVTEHEWIATVLGSLLGIVAGGRRISFRALHVWSSATGSSAARTSGSTAAASPPS